MRTTVFDFACSIGHKECLKRVGEEFSKWIVDPTSPPHPDIRNLVYYYGMAEAGNADSWEKMLNAYKNEQDAQEKVKLMYGLTGITDERILKHFLELAKDESIIRSQDYFTVLRNIADNKYGEQIVWDFVRENWLYLSDRFTLNNRYLGQMVKSITSKFATEERKKEVSTLNKNNRFFKIYINLLFFFFRWKHFLKNIQKLEQERHLVNKH